MGACLRCGGDGWLPSGEPCPECSKKLMKTIEYTQDIPQQYQGVVFDKAFLPLRMQGDYGSFLENTLHQIVANTEAFTRNLLICSKPNSGKTIWAYNVIAKLSEAGYRVPPIRDITEIRNILNGFDQDEYELYSNSKCAIIRIPADVQPWMFDTILYILERRVNHNGFTIFIYNGDIKELRSKDRYGKLRAIEGDGAFLSLLTKSFLSYDNKEK